MKVAEFLDRPVLRDLFWFIVLPHRLRQSVETPSQPKDRANFEAFVRSRMFTKWDLVRNERGHYKEYYMQAYWEVWQAALATVPPLANPE